MSADVNAITASTARSSSLDVLVEWAPSFFVHIETPAERYMRLSNRVANAVAFAMENGWEESTFEEGAEIADALALLSDVSARLAA